MGVDSWSHTQFLHHKVRHMLRRGYLKKTYYDHKILEARVCTGVEDENDRLEVMHPVGYLGRVKPGEKVEILTMDVGADPSRRIVWHIIGDRATHPKVDEGESILYTPGDKKKFVRVRKGPDNGGDPNAEYGQNKRKGAIETDGDDLPIQETTKDAHSTKTDKGIGNDTKGNYTIKAANNTQFAAQKHIREGEHHINGEAFVQGKHHAIDHLAGGGTEVSEAVATLADGDREDGSKNWSATGKPGKVSLLATAAAVAQLVQQVAQIVQQQNQTNSDVAAQIAALDARLKALGG